MRLPATLVLLLLPASLLAGCHEPDSAPVFRYVARDYSFEGPDELPEGWVTLELENAGDDIHHMQLFRLEEGHTAADLLGALANHTEPEWAIHSGGPNPAKPGGPARATVNLATGSYVLVCVIPDREGIPHFMHGMMREITVKDEFGEGAAEPSADLTLTLSDFEFQLESAPSAGTQWVRVVNEGPQPHEVGFAKLDEGATPMDLIVAFGPNATGPPPGRFVGGISAIAAGQTAYFEAPFEPGDYAFLCFVTDPASGMPHFAMGMVHSFTVS